MFAVQGKDSPPSLERSMAFQVFQNVPGKLLQVFQEFF